MRIFWQVEAATIMLLEIFLKMGMSGTQESIHMEK
jgi:hypothetical protein